MHFLINISLLGNLAMNYVLFFIEVSYFWYMIFYNFMYWTVFIQISSNIHGKCHPRNFHEIIFIGASILNFDHFMEIAIHFMDIKVVRSYCLICTIAFWYLFSNFEAIGIVIENTYMCKQVWMLLFLLHIQVVWREQDWAFIMKACGGIVNWKLHNF